MKINAKSNGKLKNMPSTPIPGGKAYSLKSLIIKLCCVAFAFVMWLYVTGDQNFERTFTDIPVTIEGEDALAASGLEAISDSTTLAKVTVSGKRSLVNSLQKKDVSAYVSVKGISSSQQYVLPIKVRVGSEGVSAVAEPESVNIYIDRITLRSVSVTAEIVAGGVKDTDVEDIIVKLDTGEITVEGPGEIVSGIAGAVARLDLGGVISSSVDVTGEIVLVDRDGNAVESEYVSVTPSSVNAHIPVYFSKNVRVVPKFVDGDADAYNYTVSVPHLTLRTEDRRLLESVESIYTKPISLAGEVKGKSKYELDIPDGIVVASGVSSVEIEIRNYSNTSVILDNITFINLDKSLVVDKYNKEIEVKFTGDTSAIHGIKSEDYYCVADMGKYTKPGEYEVVVSVNRSPASMLDNDEVYIEGTYKIKVTLADKTGDAPDENDDTNTGSNSNREENDEEKNGDKSTDDQDKVTR